MTFVIAESCIDVRDKACIDACPVDCIYEGNRTLYIHPEECIECGVCESVCPVAAIFPEHTLPEASRAFLDINGEYFEPAVSGLGSPGGWEREPSGLDHPIVANWPETRDEDP